MEGLQRFETIAAAYIMASDAEREAALALIPPKERETFLKGVGLYHLLTDDEFYRQASRTLARTVYEELK